MENTAELVQNTSESVEQCQLDPTYVFIRRAFHTKSAGGVGRSGKREPTIKLRPLEVNDHEYPGSLMHGRMLSYAFFLGTVWFVSQNPLIVVRSFLCVCVCVCFRCT